MRKKKLGREMFCPKCNKMVFHVRGKIPKCPKCGGEVQAVA